MDYAGAWRANGGKWDWALALADGSVVVWLGTDHAARIAAGATRASPVPDWVQARAGAVFRGYGTRPFDAPETLVAAPLPAGTPREAYDSGLTLSARLLAWIWNTAGGDAPAAAARPESKGPYRVR